MATNVIETYTKHCQDVEEAYKSLHQQHLTVFGAFQRLQQAATGLRKSTEHIHKALKSSVADEELGRMLDEQEMIMNKLRLMERENAGLVGVGDKEGDPMTSKKYVKATYDIKKYTQRGGGGTPASIPDDPLSTSTHHQHPRLSRLPPYDGYHESHVAPYKKTSGGRKIPDDTPYLDEIKAWAPEWFKTHPFTSFYGYTNALVDYKHPLPSEFADAVKHNPTLHYPFRRMLSEIVGNVRWCDYVFHHRIPGMFTMDELKTLSALKADAYNPCLEVVVTDDKAGTETKKWQTLFENDYKTHNHRTRIEVKGVPEVQYFLPAFEKVRDTLTLLFHVARGSRTKLEEPPATLSYRVVTPNPEDYTEGELEEASVLKVWKNTDLQNRRNTFRKYAFFHASTVPDNAETRTAIIRECITEFTLQHNTIADTWGKGYERLRTAVTAEASTEHVQKLLSAMQST